MRPLSDDDMMRPLSDDDIRLIRARAPELADVDFEALAGPAPTDIPVEIYDRLLEVIEAFQARLDLLEKDYVSPRPRQ